MDLIWTALAAVLSFGVTALLGRWIVPFLHRINFGQTIREVGPTWHRKKNGTPTMGGVIIIIAVVICSRASPWRSPSACPAISRRLRRTPVSSP